MKSFCELQIVIPVYEDWESVSRLLPMVDEQLMDTNISADIMLVDDCSQQPRPITWKGPWKGIRSIRVLRLKRNLGHQRAICIALCHLNQQTEWKRVLIMDGDGEDSPTDIPKLIAELEKSDSSRVVFAERTRRSEGYIFAFFYFLYRALHWILVGHRIRVGNFSVMDRKCLESLCVSWELWNHYAAAVFACRQPMSFVATARGERLAGKSKMRFADLVMHGLSALSVFSDRISTRLLLFSAGGTIIATAGLALLTAIRLFTDYGIPSWATNAFGILTLLLAQIVAFTLIACFVVLFTRGLNQFIPTRDFGHFVLKVEETTHG